MADQPPLRCASDFDPEVLPVFHNDTTPRHDPEAARLAWSRTIELFNRLLRG